jgi:hypothetical protein
VMVSATTHATNTHTHTLTHRQADTLTHRRRHASEHTHLHKHILHARARKGANTHTHASKHNHTEARMHAKTHTHICDTVIRICEPVPKPSSRPSRRTVKPALSAFPSFIGNAYTVVYCVQSIEIFSPDRE